MSIKINDLTSQQNQKSSEGRASSSAPTSAPTSGKVSTGAAESDTITLTQAAQYLSKLGSSMPSEPVTDTQRVSEIRDALQAGTYQIDAESVAEKLLAFESAL